MSVDDVCETRCREAFYWIYYQCLVCRRRCTEELQPHQVVRPPRPSSPYSVYCVRRPSGIRYYHRSKADQAVEPRSKSTPSLVCIPPDSTASKPPIRGRVSRRQDFNNSRIGIGARSKDRKLSTKPTSSKQEHRKPPKTPYKQKHNRKYSPKGTIEQEKPNKDIKRTSSKGVLKQPAAPQRIELKQSRITKNHKDQDNTTIPKLTKTPYQEKLNRKYSPKDTIEQQKLKQNVKSSATKGDLKQPAPPQRIELEQSSTEKKCRDHNTTPIRKSTKTPNKKIHNLKHTLRDTIEQEKPNQDIKSSSSKSVLEQPATPQRRQLELPPSKKKYNEQCTTPPRKPTKIPYKEKHNRNYSPRDTIEQEKSNEDLKSSSSKGVLEQSATPQRKQFELSPSKKKYNEQCTTPPRKPTKIPYKEKHNRNYSPRDTIEQEKSNEDLRSSSSKGVLEQSATPQRVELEQSSSKKNLKDHCTTPTRKSTQIPHKEKLNRKYSLGDDTNEQEKSNEDLRSSSSKGAFEHPATPQRRQLEQSLSKKNHNDQRTTPIHKGDFYHNFGNRERSAFIGYVQEDQKSSPSKYLPHTDRITTRRLLPSIVAPLEPPLSLYGTLERLRLLSRRKFNADYCSERVRTYRRNCCCIAAAVPIKSEEEFLMNDELSPYSRSSPPSPARASSLSSTYSSHLGTYCNLSSISSQHTICSDLQGYKEDRLIMPLHATDRFLCSKHINRSPTTGVKLYLKNSKI